MIVAQSLAAVKAGLSPGGARSPLVPIHRGRALTNLFGTSPDNSVLTNNPFYCGEVFYFAKMQILPNKPISKIHKTLPANGIRKTLRPFGTQTNPNQLSPTWFAASKFTGERRACRVEDGSNQVSPEIKAIRPNQTKK